MTMARSLIATLIFPIALLGCPLLACSQQATGRSSAGVPLAKSSDALDDTNKKKRQDGWLLNSSPMRSSSSFLGTGFDKFHPLLRL